MNETHALTKVAIYHPLEGRRREGYQLVGEFAVDPGSGDAVLSVVIEEVRPQLERFGQGMGSMTLRRAVLPSEGELFLRTMQETFQSSSYWRIVDESPGASSPGAPSD